MRIILITIFLTNLTIGFAQNSNLGFMISASRGTVLPISPTVNSSPKDYIGLNSFDIRINYLLNNNRGIQINYAFQEFRAGTPNTSFLKSNQLGFAIIFNLGHIKNIVSANQNFRLYTRLGFGLNIIYHDAYETKVKKNITSFFQDIRRQGDNHERTGSINIGISPSYKITDILYLKLDITYVQNIQSEFGFDGYWNKNNTVDIRNNFLTFSLGLNLFLKKGNINNHWKKYR